MLQNKIKNRMKQYPNYKNQINKYHSCRKDNQTDMQIPQVPRISNLYNNKTIAILNAEGFVGKLLLRKLLLQVGDCISKVILIDTRVRAASINGNVNGTTVGNKMGFNAPDSGMFYLDMLDRDLAFKGIKTQHIKQKIFIKNLHKDKLLPHQNIGLNQKQERQRIDILFNCHVPQDLTRNTLESCLASHIMKPKQIVAQISKLYAIQKLVLLSSIYGQNPGFIPESTSPSKLPQSPNTAQNLLYNPEQLPSPQKLKQTLADIFASDYEIWQWSIMYMEATFNSSISKSVQVVRVPLIGPTLEHYEGYLQNFSSLTSLIYDVSKGTIDVLQGNSENIIDIVPGDFVANYMIIIGVLASLEPQKEISGAQKTPEPQNLLLQSASKNPLSEVKKQKYSKHSIHNLSTSSRNPVSLSKFSGYITESWIEYLPQNLAAKQSSLKILQKKWQRRAYSIQSRLPSQAKARLAHLFDIKSWKIQVQQDTILANKKFQTIKKYRYFLEHQWICQSNKSIDLFSLLSSEDQIKYNFNVNSINWKIYAKLCCYSINKYLLGVHVQKFNPASMDLLALQRKTYFADIVWALTQGKSIPTQSSIQIKRYILSTKSVKEAIQQLVQEQTKKLQQTPTAYDKVYEQFYKVADQMCTQMFSQYSMNSIRGFAWFLHKVFRTIYQKVVVDKKAIMKLKNHDEKTNGPLIIIPTHRSYIDFLIMSYVFFGYGIKVPHIAAAQDFLNMAVVHILLRKSGAFFIKRDQKRYRNLYKAIMSQYISKLLSQNHYLQFFIQGTRSRVGKMLQPKYGILSIVCRNVLDGKIPDAQILPVTVNYQKILQGTSFTYQLMGQTKVKQSLSRLIKAADVLKQNYGRIYIQLCQPISVKKYFQKNMPKYIDKPAQQYQLTLNQLGYKIVYSLTDQLVITSPAIISSIILMDRIGISDDRLSEKAQWLSRQITSRGIKVARTQSDSSISITSTLGLMSDIVNKSKKDMFQVQVTFDQGSFVQLFTLTYYRNTLTHIFFQEALIAVSMAGFGYQDMTECKIQIQKLRNSVMFLAKLLKKQYVLNKYIADNPSRFEQLLHDMIQRGIIQTSSSNIQGTQTNESKPRVLLGIKNPDANIFIFYCSLIWPLVQSYWICILYFFKLIKDNISMQMPKLQSQIQWFGQSIFSERIILHLQAISMDTIKNATAIFKAMKVIGQSSIKNTNSNNSEFESAKSGIRVLVSQTQLKAIERLLETYLKSKYANSIKGSLGNGRGSVNLDFPFLSKL